MIREKGTEPPRLKAASLDAVRGRGGSRSGPTATDDNKETRQNGGFGVRGSGSLFPKVAPSILSADFADMGREVERVEAWGADYVHFDVMDGSFVSAITFGPAMCRAVRKRTSLPLDVHLMVEHPETHITQFRDAGADILTFHAEADRHIHRTLQSIRLAGMKSGVVLNPASPVCLIEHVLELCDMVLLMSVNPGAGGQSFIAGVLPKIKALRAMADACGLALDIEVDGGINPTTARQCIDAGANVLVAGNSVFTAPDPAAMVKAIREGKPI